MTSALPTVISTGDEPLTARRHDGTLKQFLISFAAPQRFLGYLASDQPPPR